MKVAILASLLYFWFSVVAAYYVPGTYPEEFDVGDKLQAHVNSLTSFETELPYDYYSLPFCKPAEGVHRVANTANPGTIIMGLRIENSPYNFAMKVEQKGLLACVADPLTKKDVENIKTKIDELYRINMMLDNLPITVYDLLDEEQEFVRPGFEFGYKVNGSYYIYNHLIFNILVHQTHGEYRASREKFESYVDGNVRRLRSLRTSQASSGHTQTRHLQETSDTSGTAATADKVSDASALAPALYMVVGFEVTTCSIAREPGKPIQDITCGSGEEGLVKPQLVAEGARIMYTYDVYWQDSDIKWASRWDAYLRMPGGKVHWFSILNSSLVVLVMSGLVAAILVRTVRRDLSRYEALQTSKSADLHDDVGWKLVAGDVLRSPASAAWLAAYIGSGVQITATAGVTLILATLGFLSPAARGALLTTMMLLYVTLALLSGYTAVMAWGVAERSYDGWLSVSLRAALYYPGIVMAIFTLLNLVIHHTGSTGAVPIGMYFSLVAVWFLVSVPLTFLGGHLATKLPIIDYPVKTNQIPRHVPPPPLAAHPWLLFFASGALPFCAVFIELYFALTSLWLGYFYYLFGFALLISILAIVITAEISILCTYVQLCAEDYQWWWRSFHRGGSSIIYVAVYAFAFMFGNTASLAGFLPMFIYVSYASILLLGVYLAMGTVGLLASFWFVVSIFRAIKQD